ncbi:hypothetical protein FRB98_001569 [Tulasnella sp. 332]|nr:hypothetical protein FRB98_001569 [Tulasnella sp. 332]
MPALPKSQAAAAQPARVSRTRKTAASTIKLKSAKTTTVDQSTLSEEDLATKFATALHIQGSLNDNLGPGSSRATTSRAASVKSRTKATVTAVDPNPPRPKKAPSTQITTPESSNNSTKENAAPQNPNDDGKKAMSVYNESSQVLGKLVQAGWKASTAPRSLKSTKGTKPGSTLGEMESFEAVTTIASSCQDVLRAIRKTNVSYPVVDIERAAGSLVGKLLSLELYQPALACLRDTKIALLCLYPHGEHATTTIHANVDKKSTLFSLVDHAADHCLPLPPTGIAIDSTILNLLAMLQLNAITALARLSRKTDEMSLDQALRQQGSILDWHYVYRSPDGLEPARTVSIYNSVARNLSTLDASSLSLFRVRGWAMECLIVSRALDESTLWEQSTKCAKSYVNSQGVAKSTENDVAAAREICSFFDRLVKTAEGLHDSSKAQCASLLLGSGFVLACEYWMRFAKYLKDLPSMDKITRLLQRPSEVEALSSGSSSIFTSMGASELRAVVARATFALQQAGASGLSVNSATSQDSIPLLDVISALPRCTLVIREGASETAPVDDTKPSAWRKLSRTVDDLSRICENALRSSGECDTNSQEIQKVRSLMDAIVHHGEQVLNVVHKAKPGLAYTDATFGEILEGTLDGLFVLARSLLQTTSLATAAIPAFTFIQRAFQLAHLDEATLTAYSTSKTTERLKYANTLRSISASYHNNAATLLNGGKEAASASFWKRAAEVGELALTVWDASQEAGSELDRAKDLEAWKLLREKHVPSRWDMVGFALWKAGERKPAYDAYIRSLQTRPKSVFDRIVEDSAVKCSRAVMAADPKLMSTVEKITSIATFDLFLKEDGASLRKALEDARVPAEAVGAILEHQVTVLDLSLHKEEVGPVMRVVLKDLKDLYARGSDFPVRRARVLLRSLEFAYAIDDSSMAPSPLVILGLLNSKNMGKDSALTRVIPQYIVSLELMMCLQAHRQQSADASTSVVLLHACKAIKVLRDILHPLPSQVAMNTKGHVKGKGSKAPASARRATKITAAAGASRTKSAIAAKTPKKKIVDIESITEAVQSLSIEVTSEDSVLLDDGERFYRKLSSMSHLLGLLGHVVPRIELLDLICALGERELLPSGADELAQEYVKLGKTETARGILAHVSEFVENAGKTISDDMQVLFMLRYAELSAIVGDAEQGSIAYGKAMRISDRIPTPDKTTSTLVRARARIGLLERSALACTVYAAVQLARDDLNASISGLLQALRLWNRATDMLLRLNQGGQPPTAVSSSSPRNPFRDSPEPVPLVSVDDTPSQQTWDVLVDGLHWRLADGLVNSLFALGKIHFIRGSVKASDFFIGKAKDLVTNMNAPILLSRALAKEAERELAIGHFDAGHELLVQASYAWEQTPDIAGPDLADVHRLQGDHSLRTDQPEEAMKIYDMANQLLVRFGAVFEDAEALLGAAWKRRANPGALILATGPDTVMPALLASVLRQHIWLLRMEDGEEDTYNDLLAKFLALPPSVETKVEVNALMGKLTLEEVQARLAADIYLSSLTESTIALPLGMSSGEGVSVPTSTAELLACLANADRFFWAGLELSSARGEVHQVREAALSLLLIRAFQTSLGKGGKNGSVIAAALLVTLRRELMECIDYKFRSLMASDDLTWRAMNTNGLPLHTGISVAKRMLFTNESDDEGDNEEPDQERSLQAYWQSVKTRYRTETMDAASLAAPQVDHLPESWTVIHISVSDDKETLYISRQRPHSEPLIFCLPLNRQGKRDGIDGDEEGFSYDKAIEEMNDIIRLNDETAKSAKDLVDKEARVGWWADRTRLDGRIKALLENIEYCWLGAFKTIFAEPSDTSPERLAALRTKMDKIFKRNGIVTSEKRAQLNVRVDDAILECFSTLSPKCRDEEIEDFIYFVLDLYQLHGAPIALAEVDIDQVAIDLRAILEEHATKSMANTKRKDSHLFLVLDKYVQGLPWESISLLRGRSVSRIPSMTFLIDRVEMVRQLQPASNAPSGDKVDRTTVDPLKTFYVLNPSGDLTTTQTTYEQTFKDLEEVGWRGVTGRVPSEEEIIHGLEKSDLMLYFGHGGAQQYIRSHKLRHLPRCAATMLWGCSSGAMKEMGDFDRVGTPNHYMLAGCPTLVANLWDVTDREIDRVAQSVLTKLRIDRHHLLGRREGGRSDETGAISIVQAVAESRDSCKLKYLTGAAPVVYGIPFYL